MPSHIPRSASPRSVLVVVLSGIGEALVVAFGFPVAVLAVGIPIALLVRLVMWIGQAVLG